MMLDCERMRQLRLKQGLTQHEAAELAGMHQRQNWSNIENGHETNLTLEKLDRIAAALGVDPCELLLSGGKGKKR